MGNEVTQSDLNEKVNKRDLEQFFRDLRDLGQAAERRVSTRLHKIVAAIDATEEPRR